MSQDDLIVVVKDDPFSDRPPRLLKAKVGTPISELVNMAGFEPLEIEHTEASINGEYVAAELWAETPASGHTQMVVLPQGGGDDGNKLLRTVLSLAVIVGAFFLGPQVAAAFAATGTKAFAAISALTTGVVSTVGQLAVNAIVPPPGFEAGDPPDPVYFIEGARNRLNPLQPIQTVLGRHRVVPNLAARPYPEIRGDDTYYYLVVDLGPIDVEVTDRRVGDTPLANIDGVFYQSRLVPTDPHPTMASRQVIPETVGATLLEADPELRRTATDVIDCDLIFAFPQGLGKSSKQGNPESNTLTVRVRYREVNNPGPAETFGDWQFASTRVNSVYPDFRGFENFDALSGGGIGGNPNLGASGTFTFREAKPAQPFFRQVGFSFPTEGTYEVELLRTSEDRNEARVFDDITWQTILSKRDEPIINRDDVAYEVYRFKGTDETSGAIDELNMVIGRWIPSFPDAVLDQADLSAVTVADLSQTTVSSNPWEQALWLKRNGFEAREPVANDGFDWPSFAVAAKDARDRGLTFDYVINSDVNVDDLVNLVASSGGEGRVYSYNNVLTAGVDRPIAAPSHVFRDGTARNISTAKSFPEDVHAYIVTFNDANNGWRTREVTVYLPGFTALNATKFERISLPGKTNWDDLHRAIGQLWRNSRLQASTMDLEVPKDSLDNTLRPMGRVSVATRVITQVQGSGIIRGISTNAGQVTAVELDQEIEQGPSFPGLALKWVALDGNGNQVLSAPSPLVVPAQDERGATVTLVSPVAVAGGPDAGEDYIIGPVGTDLFEGLLQNAEDAGEDWIRLALKSYADARFNETGFTIPAYATAPVLPLGSSPPQPVFVSAEASNFKITISFSIPDGFPQPLREIRVWRAYAPPAGDPEPNTLSVFEQLPSLGPEVRQLIDSPGLVGQRLVYRFQSVAVSGRVSPILQTPIVTVADALPLVGNFAAVGGTELGGESIINPVIIVTWDADNDAAIQEAVIEARIVAKDAGGVRLPDAQQPEYSAVTTLPAAKGTTTIRGVPPEIDMDVQLFYLGRRGEIGAVYEARDVAVPAGSSGAVGSVDWGNIIGTPLELVDGRVGNALSVSGDLIRPLPISIANSSNLLRWPGGDQYLGTLDANRTEDNISLGIFGQGWGATATETQASNEYGRNLVPAGLQVFERDGGEGLDAFSANRNTGTTAPNLQFPDLISRRYDVPGSQTLAGIRVKQDQTDLIMNLPPGRYGYRIAFQGYDPDITRYRFQLRNKALTQVRLNRSLTYSGSGAREMTGIFDIASGWNETQFLIQLGVDTSNTAAFYLDRMQIVRIPPGTTDFGDWLDPDGSGAGNRLSTMEEGADQTAGNVSAGIVGQGGLATEDNASRRVYADFDTATSGFGFSNSEFSVGPSDQVTLVTQGYANVASATISCDGSPVEIMFTAFFGEFAPGTTSESPELKVKARVQRVGGPIISQGGVVANLRADGITNVSRVFGGTYRVVDMAPGGTPASPVSRTYQLAFSTPSTAAKSPAPATAAVNPNVYSGLRLTVHDAGANDIS